MANGQSRQNPLNLPPPIPQEDLFNVEKQKCEAKGGRWDEATKTCILPEKEPVQPTTPEVFQDPKTGRASGITLEDGRTFLGLSPEDVQTIATGEQARTAIPAGTAPVGTAALQQRELEAGQQLAGQVGQLDRQAISPTGLSTEEALTVGIVDAIPSAIKSAGATAGGGAALGGAIGVAGGPLGAGGGAVIGAAIGGAAGFVGSLASSVKSNFASQRRDTTTAQQRVLDEGKQTMKDWATLAKNDPANKHQYLGEYNKVSSQIDQAYRQMKLDTSRDVAKFETALPNLAEFEAFYAAGGERDALNIEMQNSLIAQSPENYEMLELSHRRFK